MRLLSTCHLGWVLAVSLGSLPAGRVLAADGVWTNLLGGSWAAAGNWAASTLADGAGSRADFATLDIPTNVTVTLDGARTVGSLVFGDAVTPDSNWTLSSGSGGPLTLLSSGTPAINVSNQALTVNLQLAGSNGVAKTGAGTLRLAAAGNPLTGGVTVAAGTLVLQANGVFGGSGLFTTNHALTVGSGAVLSFAGAWTTGDGYRVPLAVRGGALTGTSIMTYVNALTLDTAPGSLAGAGIRAGYFAPGVPAWNVTAAASGSTISAPVTLATGTGALSQGPLVLTVEDGAATNDLTIGAAVSNLANPAIQGGFVKRGAGTLWLTGASSYSDGTVLSQGRIRFGAGAGLGVGAVTLGDVETGANDITLLATSALTINNAITVTNAGTGSVTLGTDGFAASNVNCQYGGRLTLHRDIILQAGSDNRTTFGNLMAGTGNITVTSPFAANRRIVFDRPAGGTNSFAGTITLGPAADLQLGVNNSIGNRTVPDATPIFFSTGSRLRLAPLGAGDGETIGALNSLTNGAGLVDMFTGTSFTLTIGAGDGSGSFSGGLTDTAGTLNVTKTGAGTQVLSGTSSYAGVTTVNGGTLALAAAGMAFPSAASAGQFTAGHTVTVNAGATLSLDRIWAWGGGLANQAIVNGGTLLFNNDDNYAGRITLNGGAIVATGGIRPWRTGNFGDGLITVVPNAVASTIHGSLCLVRSAAATNTTFDVGDGASAADLDMPAVIFDHTGGYEGMSVTKAGAGCMVLGGNNTYLGPTKVTGGTLLVNGVHSGAGAWTVSGGALGGAGTVAGTVTVNAGGALTPGGTNTTARFTGQNSVTLAAGATLHVDIRGGVAGAATDGYDQLTMTAGTLTVGGANLDVRVPPGMVLPEGATYTIATGFAALSGTFSDVPDGGRVVAGDYAFVVDYDENGKTIILTAQRARSGFVLKIR